MTDDRTPTTRRASLTADVAFVVHFAASTADTPETVKGRIEHITSGRSTRFASIAELIGFMQHIVAAGSGHGAGEWAWARTEGLPPVHAWRAK